MPALNPIVAASRSQEYENLMAKLFQRAGRRVQRQPEGADAKPKGKESAS